MRGGSQFHENELTTCASPVLAWTEPDFTIGTVGFSNDQMHVVFTTHSNGSAKPGTLSNGLAFGQSKRIYREFTDGKRLVFGYGVDIVQHADWFKVTVVPLGQDYLTQAAQKLSFDREHPPTVGMSRELPNLYNGDKASIEVLKNPETGEVITDTIEISLSMPPSEQPAPTTGMSFTNLTAIIDGVSVASDSGGVWGDGVLMAYVPGHGFYYFSRQPVSGYNFQKIGSVDSRKLTFTLDKKRYEFVSQKDILGGVKSGEVWVYYIYNPPRLTGFKRQMIPFFARLRLARWTRILRESSLGP